MSRARRGERNAACNIIQHVRFGAGSLMVWGGISLEGCTDLHVQANSTLTAVRYQDEILRATLVLSSSWCRTMPVFMWPECAGRPWRTKALMLLAGSLVPLT